MRIRVVAFLRGINVSGQKMIKMKDLRDEMAERDFLNVETYIQSGNVMFECNRSECEKKRKELIKLLKEKFGFDVDVFLKTQSEMKDILDNNPFLDKHDIEAKMLYVTLFDNKPSDANIELLESIRPENEHLEFRKDLVYLYYPDGYGRSRLTGNIIESKLKLRSTSRNWNTMNKVYTMMCDDSG